MKNSYDNKDVIMLFKDLSRVMEEKPAEERERLIQSGVHYSEMLPQEKEPSVEYEALYEKALNNKKHDIALQTAVISEMALSAANGNTPVILSLARAGIPVGILMKRYLEKKGVECVHFAISIIRDKGIDEIAMQYIYDYCMKNNIAVGSNIIFVDGWTGKGVIYDQVREAVAMLKENAHRHYACTDKATMWDGLRDDLYVLADPANITPFCGTHEDYLIPCACLNSTCAGLISRTILNYNIGPRDFHGAVYFEKFEKIDKSREFVDAISAEFKNITNADIAAKEAEYLIKDGKWAENVLSGEKGMDIVKNIQKDFEIKDYKKIKPGIGETTRVLLRRIPDCVLISDTVSMEDPEIAHILVLCKEKGIPIRRYPLGNYKVCGVIKELSDI